MHLATTTTHPAPTTATPTTSSRRGEAVAAVASVAGAAGAVKPSPTAEAAKAAASDPCWANLSAGKPLPGPDEWRALERRAASLRLR